MSEEKSINGFSINFGKGWQRIVWNIDFLLSYQLPASGFCLDIELMAVSCTQKISKRKIFKISIRHALSGGITVFQ